LQYAISSSESVAARLGKVNLASPLQIEASTIVIAARKAESDSSCQTLNPTYINSMKETNTPTPLRNKALDCIIIRKATKHWSFRKPRKAPKGPIQINNFLPTEV
jgi:hypothetical protein